MKYTSHGLMTAEDLAEYDELYDTGTVTISADEDPQWFERAASRGPCPCGELWDEHESVTVARANDENMAGCTLWDGTTFQVPIDDPEPLL